MRRRTFLRTAAAAAGTAAATRSAEAVPGTGPEERVPGTDPDGSRDADRADGDGIVWSRTESMPGTQRLLDVVAGGSTPHLACGGGVAGDTRRAIVRSVDRFGRQVGQRRGPEWGDRADALTRVSDGFVLAGVDAGAPHAVGFASLSDVRWTTTLEGNPASAVEVASTGGVHAVGWTDRETGVATMVGLDGAGEPRWRARPGIGGDRRLAALVATEAATGDRTTPVLVAVGETLGAGPWASVLRSDGTVMRERKLETPALGVERAITDGPTVLLAGTTADGWWLQRRAPDLSVDWTAAHDGGEKAGVDDVVARADGYAVLGHASDGVVLLRTDDAGQVRWRGRYTPGGTVRTGSEDPTATPTPTPGAGGAGDTGKGTTTTRTSTTARYRGHAMVPVGRDQFVLVGATAPGEEGRDWWVARVGEPGATGTGPETPARTPTATPKGGRGDGALTEQPGVSPERAGETGPVRTPTGGTEIGSLVWGGVAAVGLGGWAALRVLGD